MSLCAPSFIFTATLFAELSSHYTPTLGKDLWHTPPPGGQFNQAEGRMIVNKG